MVRTSKIREAEFADLADTHLHFVGSISNCIFFLSSSSDWKKLNHIYKFIWKKTICMHPLSYPTNMQNNNSKYDFVYFQTSKFYHFYIPQYKEFCFEICMLVDYNVNYV
jgi:hypothetical protein